jgi:D-amino peptidase
MCPRCSRGLVVARSVIPVESILPRVDSAKVYISVDMEGIGGIVEEIETDPEKGGERYAQSRHRMTAEANAAIEGCLKAGAEEILVADSHWNFNNLIPEELNDAAVLLRGAPRSFSMVHDLDRSFGAALFIGYHAMAGTPRAILDHTFTGRIRTVEVNGTAVGETGLNAYVAGDLGVPVVLVTGDSAVAAEAKALLANVRTVAVKEATGATAAKNLHPRKVQGLIRSEAEKAVRAPDRMKPLVASKPVRIAVEFKGTGSADLAEMVPGVTRHGGTRIEFEAPGFREAFRTFYAVVTISGDG